MKVNIALTQAELVEFARLRLLSELPGAVTELELTVAPNANDTWPVTVSDLDTFLSVISGQRRQERISVIKFVRAITGTGLKEAKDLIDKYLPYAQQ
jgi:ribosomal protein L7/L12